MAFYYQRFMPLEAVEKYLRGSANVGMARREIAVQWGLRDHIFERNRAYASTEELQGAIRGDSMAVNSRVGGRIECGSFFSGRGRKDHRSDWERYEHPIEFRLDIDITDYAEHNPHYGPPVACGDHDPRKGACDVCWETRLAPSMRVAEELCEELLGLRHPIRVWSGNKGYHLLFMDRQALRWDDETRLGALHLLRHPAADVERRICEHLLWPLFERHYLAPSAPYQLDPVVASLDTGVQTGTGQTGVQVYRFVEQLLAGDELASYKRRLLRALYWPRVDEGPLNSHHLLKVPFCVHEKTKKVSVPLPRAEGFLPSQAPRLEDVLLGNFCLDKSAAYMTAVIDAAATDAGPRPAATRSLPPSRYTLCVDWSEDGTPYGYADMVGRVTRVFKDYRAVVEVPDQEWAARVQIRMLDAQITVVVTGSDDPLPLEPDVWIVALAGEAPDDASRPAKQVIALSDCDSGSGLVVENAEQAETAAKRVRQHMMMMAGR